MEAKLHFEEIFSQVISRLRTTVNAVLCVFCIELCFGLVYTPQ
jgi:hypothetical protein